MYALVFCPLPWSNQPTCPTVETVSSIVSAPASESWLQTDHCMTGLHSVTLTPTHHLAVILFFCLFVSVLLCWPWIHRLHSLTESSELLASHQYPVWNCAQPAYVILRHRKTIIIAVMAFKACVREIFGNCYHAQKRPYSLFIILIMAWLLTRMIV